MSGAMAVSGFPDVPTKEQVPHVDYLTATLTALGVVSAIYHRQKTGEGQKVEFSLSSVRVVAMPNFGVRRRRMSSHD
jgi:crotonobetainyl-CoA:carnitine CoA-transferase CaiB-like acyl-CoA transferase